MLYCKPFQSLYKKNQVYINFKLPVLNYFIFQFRKWEYPTTYHRVAKH